MQILEIWGNGKEIIIKYKRKGFDNIWYSASKWMRNNSDMNDNFLIKNGYKKLDLDKVGI